MGWRRNLCIKYSLTCLSPINSTKRVKIMINNVNIENAITEVVLVKIDTTKKIDKNENTIKEEEKSDL